MLTTSAVRLLTAGIAIASFGCGDSPVRPSPDIQLGAIGINATSTLLELGTRDTITALTLDMDGDTVVVPVVWRSSNERVAIFERGGVLVARDTGITMSPRRHWALPQPPLRSASFGSARRTSIR